MRGILHYIIILILLYALFAYPVYYYIYFGPVVNAYLTALIFYILFTLGYYLLYIYCNIFFENGVPSIWIGRFSKRKSLDIVTVLHDENSILDRGILNSVSVSTAELPAFKINFEIFKYAFKFATIISLFLLPFFVLSELPNKYKEKYYSPAKVINEKDFVKGIYTGTSELWVKNDSTDFYSNGKMHKNFSSGEDMYFKLIIKKDGKEAVVREFFLPVSQTHTETKIPVETNVMLIASGKIYGNGNFKYYDKYVYQTNCDFSSPLKTNFFHTDKSNLETYDLDKFKNLK